MVDSTLLIPIDPPGIEFRTWRVDEIFNNVEADYLEGAKYVPNVGDGVLAPEGWLRVTAVDESTKIATLTPLYEDDLEELNPDDLGALIGSGPAEITNNYYCYMDPDEFPFRIAVDSKYYVYSPMAEHARLFRGFDISQTTGKVISVQFDMDGNFVKDTIPLHTVYDASQLPTSIKAPAEAFSNEQLLSGEVVTMVIYGNHGRIVDVVRMRVILTNHIRPNSLGQRYISSIRLLSPHIDESDTETIRFPQFMNKDAMNIRAEISYTDGRVIEEPIDGDRISLIGYGAFDGTVIGATEHLHLRYRMGEDENNLTQLTANGKYLMKKYRVKVVEEERFLAMKLYSFPRWIDRLEGYRLEHWLVNLEREVYYRVTDYVTTTENSMAWNPTRYGTEQTLTFSLNLKDVNPSYPDYNHVQTNIITLLRPGDDTTSTRWRTKYGSLDEQSYGQNINVTVKYHSVDKYRYDISCGIPDVNQWLNSCFYALEPLYSELEGKTPEPTHLLLRYSGQEFEIPMTRWRDGWDSNIRLDDGALVTIVFVKRMVDKDLYLGVGAMPVKNI